ncbi:MAG: ATP-binding protein [Candidatus Gastranaerophilales bacterium]|nr:ATP-binding protein [Candidatus Gastranaerophilales bacterium]
MILFQNKYTLLDAAVFASLTIGIIVAIASYIRYKKLLNKLDPIADVAMAVMHGDLAQKVKIKGKNKIARLGKDINKMIESLKDRESKIRKYQIELQGQKEYLEAVFNSLIDGIVIISKDCKIIKTNPTIEIWTNTNEEDIIGKKLTDLIRCKCEVDCSKNPDNCPLIFQNERLLPNEATIINKGTKAEKLLSLNSVPISGVIVEQSYLIVLRDITEFKEMNQMREDFMATLTHDLRVPILAEGNTLKFFLKGIFGPLTDKQREALENMLDSNNDLSRMVTGLLDAYKYDSGNIELFKEPVHLKKLVQDCIAELTPLSRKNDQSLTNFISKEIHTLNIDKNEIKRVIRNLISNSITYTPKGGSINVNAENNEKEVIISINDTGKGIAESELEQIFDRFFSKAKKFRKVGTGLGLYLSKQIVEKHGGKIWAESNLGEGSTFYFSLPLDTANIDI